MFISSVRYLCGTYILTEDEHFGSFLFEVSFYTIIRTLSVIKTQPLPQTLKLSNNNGTLPLTLSFDAKNLTNNTPYIITITDNTSNKSQHIILAKTTHRIRISNESNPTYKSEEN